MALSNEPPNVGTPDFEMLRLVQLRPRSQQHYVSQGRAVLATQADGFIEPGTDAGFFVHQTRLLSRYRYRISDRDLLPVALSNIQQHTWMGYYIAAAFNNRLKDWGSGQVQDVSEFTLALRVARYIGAGMHEVLNLTNFTQERVAFELELELDADFADEENPWCHEEFRAGIKRDWQRAGNNMWKLDFDYHAENRYDHQGEKGTARLHRGCTVLFQKADTEPRYADGVVRFAIDLQPRANWRACINVLPRIELGPRPANYDCLQPAEIRTSLDDEREIFLSETAHISTPQSDTLATVVSSALNQAKHDLIALRLHDLDESSRSWTMAAGLPIYIALFGRDTLTASWQAAMAGPEMMRGTLFRLAELQGAARNDWRDEQPGRMLHEAHTGPFAMLNCNPRSRYYGSQTTSSFYSFVVAALWHWTGDRALVRRFIEPALRALRWLDHESDHDGDGFYDYLSRSELGVRNQGWKDSGNAMVYEDGSLAEPPIATCEEQAFAYAAKLHLSEVLWWLKEKDEARRLYHEAEELKKRFNEAFWMEDEGFFAMALDSQRRQIRSIASNPGHCIASGLVEKSLVRRTAERLMQPDLFSGWGVRTLSTEHPAYNPFSYHRGSVWPVENATFALGFWRYGLHDLHERLCRAQFEAARIFQYNRLPEVFSGHPRDTEHPFPAFYPKANSPQAWSASAVFALVQSMLGLYPYAPMRLLMVDPHLPAWLPEITLHNLRVGKAAVTLRFFRTTNGESDYTVEDQRGRLKVIRQPTPWSLSATFGERMRDLIGSFAPSR